MKLLFDFSRVLLFPIDDNYGGSLNGLYKEKINQPDFQFFNYFKVNKELIEFLTSHKDTFQLYMFTSESIQNAPELEPYLKPLFIKVFSALDLNYGKKDAQAYSEIARILEINPTEITFIDDTLENIEAAKIAGLKTIHFQSNKQLIQALS